MLSRKKNGIVALSAVSRKYDGIARDLCLQPPSYKDEERLPLDIGYDLMAGLLQASAGISLETVVEMCCRDGCLSANQATEVVDAWVALGVWTIDDNNMVRVSAEGQEGMRALLEKDKPAWMKK